MSKPKRGDKDWSNNLWFTYFKGTWSRAIPDAFVNYIKYGQNPSTPEDQKRFDSFNKAIQKLQEGMGNRW